MGAYDIVLHSTAGEDATRRAMRTSLAAATFQVGEPVILQAGLLANGDTGPGGDDPTDIFGIACEPAVSHDGRLAALETGNIPRTVELPNDDKVFMARYFLSAGSVTVPTMALVQGVLGNVTYDGVDTWRFDTTAANLNCEGLDVLDRNGMSLGDDRVNAVAGSFVLFRFL